VLWQRDAEDGCDESADESTRESIWYEATCSGYHRSRTEQSPNPDISVGRRDLFKKLFVFDVRGCRLPTAQQIFPPRVTPIDPMMAQFKRRTNDCRSKLDEKDLGVWKRHTRDMLQTSNVIRDVKRVAAPELATGAFLNMSVLFLF
jgi:hypothetical protein